MRGNRARGGGRPYQIYKIGWELHQAFGEFALARQYFVNQRPFLHKLTFLNKCKQRGSNRVAMANFRIIRTAMRANPGVVSSSMTTINTSTFGTHAASDTVGIAEGSAAFDTSYFFHVTSFQ
jgi:hypothetical protein